jgi:hypothetical protein
MSGISN